MNSLGFLNPSVTDFYFVSLFSNSIIRVVNGQIDPSTVPNRLISKNNEFMFRLDDGTYRCMTCPKSYSKDSCYDKFCGVKILNLVSLKSHLIFKSSFWNVRLFSLNDDLEIPTGRLLGDVRDLYVRNRNKLSNLRYFDGESFIRVNDCKCVFKGCDCKNKKHNGLSCFLRHISHLETKEKRIMVREAGEDDQGKRLKRKIDEIDSGLDNGRNIGQIPEKKLKPDDENIKQLTTKIDNLNEKLILKEEKNKELLKIIDKQNEEIKKWQRKISDLENTLKELEIEKKVNENLLAKYLFKS